MVDLVVYRLAKRVVGQLQLPFKSPHFTLEEVQLIRPENKLVMILSKTEDCRLASADKIPDLVKEAGFVFKEVSSFTPNGFDGRDCFFV